MNRLSICLLGPFRVTLDGDPVTAFESDKVRALLAYLAVEADHPHRRERLAGLLWPEFPERPARANLSRALLNLRTAIGARSDDRIGTGDQPAPPPYLDITRQTIQFNAESDAWVDVTAFSRLLDVALPHSPELPIGDLEQATALYRGDFLEGFTLPGCPAFEEWALFEGERLRRLALDALERLGHGYEAQDDLERALAAAWRQLELDPWRESAHRQVMRLLAGSGQRASALAQYETCRQRLAEELGVEPGEQTRRLYEQIRDGAEAPGPTPAPVVPHNLPAPLTSFVGREAELAKLGECLRDPGCRLVTLVGPGGIGKTRLALEAARAHLQHFPHGVFQVRLVGLASVEAIVPTIAGAIGLASSSGGRPRQRLLDYLRARTMLLLLDNFEHLLEGAGLVVDILRAAAEVKIVITSRARLNLKGEQLFPVEGLPYPPSDALQAEKAVQYDAVKLFLSGARRICPGFQLDGHTHHVARICRTVHGMPLALLLASAWVGAMSPAEIADQVSDGAGHSLDLLESDWQDVPERHRGIRAVFDHSWRLLSERERQIFPALSVFRGGFSDEAAGAVTGASPAELRALVDKSFVQRLSPQRYEVHELLRQYGEEALVAQPAAWEGAHDRHCTYYAAALQRWGEDLKGPRQQAALAEMDAEIDNARAAWDWAVEGGQVARMEQALDGLSYYHRWRERVGELMDTWRQAMQGLSVPAPGELERSMAPSATAAREARLWLRIMAWRIWWSPALEQARERTQHSLAVLDWLEGAGCDARRERALLLHQMARNLWGLDPREARPLEEESLALYRALGDRWATADGLLHLSIATFTAGIYGEAEEDLDKAGRLAQESLDLYEKLGDFLGSGLALLYLGGVALCQGGREEGEALLRRFMAMWSGTGDRLTLSRQLNGFGGNLLWLGRFSEVQFLFEEAVPLYRELGDRLALCSAHGLLGEAQAYLGRYDEARDHFQTGLALARETGERRDSADYGYGLIDPHGLGLVELAQGRFAPAQEHLEAAISICRALDFQDYQEYYSALLACAALGLGDTAGAKGYLRMALRPVAGTPSFLPIVFALPAMALLLVERGDAARAVELYALASRHPLVANNVWFEDVAGKQIAAAAASLPPDVAAAAQDRGRDRDLHATARELLEELGDEEQG